MKDEPTYREKVEEVAEIAGEICNDWECTFISDMDSWEGEYTDKQKDVIDRLYERACESPY